MALIPLPWYIEVQRFARSMGGEIRPCTYQVTSGPDQPSVAIRTQDEEGPFVGLQIALPDAFSEALSKFTPLYYDIWAGSRKLTSGQVSDISLGGLYQLGISIPAPIYLDTAESLVFMRPDADGSAFFNQSYVIAGFHTDRATYTACRRRFKEFRSCSVGPRDQVATSSVDGPWRRLPAQPMQARLALSALNIVNSGIPVREFLIDGDYVFFDKLVQMPASMRSVLSPFSRISMYVDRPLLSYLQVRRDGPPVANSQIVDVLGSEL